MKLTKKMKTMALLLLVSGPFTLSAQTVTRFFAAGSVGNKMITNFEVHQYIQQYVLTDKVRMDLFTLSQRDLERYQSELDSLSAKLYEDTLDRMIYQRYIEEMAVGDAGTGKRDLFRTTARDYNQKVENALKEHLKPFAKEQNPKLAFGEFLQENNYPHAQGESALETYKNWEEKLHFKVKEDLRVANVSEAEIALAIKDYPRSYENPARDIMAVSRYTESEKASWKQLHGKIMTKSALESEISKRDQIVLESMQTLGSTSSLQELARDSAFMARQLDVLTQSLAEKSLQTPLLRLEDYSALAVKLADSTSPESLQEQKQAALANYMAGGSRGELVSARILALAQEIQLGGNVMGALDGQKLMALLKNKQQLLKLLQSAPAELSLEAALLHAVIPAHKNMMDAEVALARDVVKAVISEALKTAPVKVAVSFKKDLTTKEYDLIKSKVQNQFTAKALKHYRSSGIYKRSYLLARNADGERAERGESVVKRIIP